MVVEGGKGRRIECVPVELSDGTVVYARKRVGVELAEGDIQALERFNTLLKCEGCTQRAQCALNGCAHEILKGPENES